MPDSAAPHNHGNTGEPIIVGAGIASLTAAFRLGRVVQAQPV